MALFDAISTEARYLIAKGIVRVYRSGSSHSEFRVNFESRTASVYLSESDIADENEGAIKIDKTVETYVRIMESVTGKERCEVLAGAVG